MQKVDVDRNIVYIDMSPPFLKEKVSKKKEEVCILYADC